MLAIVETCKHWRHYLERSMYSVRVVTDHLNLRKFLSTKTLSRKKAKWWECLSGLDLAIEYCEGKHNPADGPSRRPDYMDEDDKPLYIVGYVTRSSKNCNMAQENSKEGGQAPKEPEVNSKPATAESQLGTIDPHEADVDNNSTNLEDELIRACLPGPLKPTSRKQKQGFKGTDKIGRRSKKIWTESKFPGITSKPTRLHLLKEDDLANKVVCQDIKAISIRESVFGSPSFELRTMLKFLQEIDPLTQEAFRARPDKQLQGDTETEPSLPEQDVVQDTDPQQNVNNNVMKRWSFSNELACYNDR